MKKLVVLALVLLVGTGFSQTILSESITVTLAGTTTSTFYFTWPIASGSGSEYRNIHSAQDMLTATALTSSADQATYMKFMATGDVYVSIVPVVGATSDADSLYAYMTPYTYESGRAAWYAVATDVSYLVFDTAGTYAQAAIDYLDWTTNTAVGVQLSNEMWSTPGAAFTFGQVSSGTGIVTLYITFYVVVSGG